MSQIQSICVNIVANEDTSNATTRRDSGLVSCRVSQPVFDRREPLGFSEIVDGVGVEERIERLGRPTRRSRPGSAGPGFHLAQAFDDKRLAQGSRNATRQSPTTG